MTRSSPESIEALRLLAVEDARQVKLHELLETIREQIRHEVPPEHRPEGLFQNIQDAVYAMRGRTPLMNDAAITSPLRASQPATPTGGEIQLQARKAPAGEWTNIHPAQLEWCAKMDYDVRAIEAPRLSAGSASAPKDVMWECGNENCGNCFRAVPGHRPSRCPECGCRSLRRLPEETGMTRSSPGIESASDACVEGREDALLTAHEIKMAKKAYLEGFGQEGNAARKEKLAQVLWDNATDIANALEAYATPLPPSAGRASAAEVEVHVHDLIAEALGQEGMTYSGVRRAARDIIKAFNILGVAQASPQHDHRVYFGCECCEEHAPENGVNCREDIGVMPDGTWLCDGCYSDCDKSTYGMVASDIDDFEFPRFEDLPRPAPYGASPIPSTQDQTP